MSMYISKIQAIRLEMHEWLATEKMKISLKK